MYMRNVLIAGVLAILSAQGLWNSDAADRSESTQTPEWGRAATDRDIQPWNIDIAPTGEGLPSGRGTVKQGAAIFAARGVPPVMGRPARKARWIAW